jgi:hypothetical protein
MALVNRALNMSCLRLIWASDPQARLLRKLLRRQGSVPTVIVTDKLRSYGAALREIGFSVCMSKDCAPTIA